MAALNKKQKEIRDSLMDELKNRGAKTQHFIYQVDEYVRLAKLSDKLQADIEKHGGTYEGKSTAGFNVVKENPAVKAKLNVNRQMLAILKALDISPDSSIGDGGDGKDLLD